MQKLIILSVLMLFFIGCSSQKAEQAVNYTGIKVSDAQLNEKKEIVHNIFNFEKEQKTVRVTTQCFGENGGIISDNDSYVMVLLPNSISGWKPECPQATKNYHIDVKEINSTG